MEHPIDKKYREYALKFYMEGAVDVGVVDSPKWMSHCPFNPHLKRSSSNGAGKCASLFAVPNEGTWRFACTNPESRKCVYGLAFPDFLRNLNPQLANQYLLERYGRGASAAGAKCSSAGRSSAARQRDNAQSRTKPQKQRPHDPSKSKSTDGQSEDRPKS